MHLPQNRHDAVYFVIYTNLWQWYCDGVKIIGLLYVPTYLLIHFPMHTDKRLVHAITKTVYNILFQFPRIKGFISAFLGEFNVP